MYKSIELGIKESLGIIIEDNVKIGIRNHKMIKRKVKRYIKGDIDDKVFLTQLGVTFLRRFTMDALLALGICKMIDISLMYVSVYVFSRLAMFIGTVVRMFIDELSN